VEQLDEWIGTCGDTSEQACIRRCPEWYSQNFSQQRIYTSALKSCISIYSKGLFNVTAVRDCLERASIPFEPPDNLATARTMLKEATNVLNEQKQNDIKIRKEELQSKIDFAQNTSNKPAATILRGIKKSEASRKTWAIIASMKAKLGTKTTLDRLQIPRTWPEPFTDMEHILLLDDPKKCNSWKTITDPTEVEYYLLLRNRLHFGQAQGTPLTEEPLRDAFDWAATTDTACSTFAGTFNSTHDVAQCQTLLDAFVKLSRNWTLYQQRSLRNNLMVRLNLGRRQHRPPRPVVIWAATNPYLLPAPMTEKSKTLNTPHSFVSNRPSSPWYC
jgi:hypothetical protein